MTQWEYLVVALPPFEAPTASRQASAAIRALNSEGAHGWEAIGMTLLDDRSVAVLLKRPSASAGPGPGDDRSEGH